MDVLDNNQTVVDMSYVLILSRYLPMIIKMIEKATMNNRENSRTLTPSYWFHYAGSRCITSHRLSEWWVLCFSILLLWRPDTCTNHSDIQFGNHGDLLLVGKQPVP